MKRIFSHICLTLVALVCFSAKTNALEFKAWAMNTPPMCMT